MKKFYLLFSAFIILHSSCSVERQLNSNRHNSIATTLEHILKNPGMKTAGFAFYAQDLNTGDTIAAYNPFLALKPASTQKLLITATALEILGPEYTFQTKLAYTGSLDRERHYLNGNIVIVGGGDPTLGSKYFKETGRKQFLNDFLNAVIRLGIGSVSGRVLADARYYDRDNTPPTRTWQNMGQYYGAAANGLTVFDNYFSILFRTGAIGDTARIVATIPKIKGLRIDNRVIADSISFDNSYVYGAPYVNKRVVKGSLPAHRIRFTVKAATPDPPLLAAQQLDATLRSHGINIKKEATTIRKIDDETGNIPDKPYHVFYTHTSVSLKEIIKQTNHYSINLFAEHLLLAAGQQLGSKKEVEACADSLIAFWTKKGMDTQGLFLADGSGLSHYNAINPTQMVYLLRYMKYTSQHFDTFYNSLPVAGKTGTVQNMRVKIDTTRELRVKSGTITRGKAYAGYLTTASGREVAFFMAANNFSCSTAKVDEYLQQLLKALQDFDE